MNIIELKNAYYTYPDGTPALKGIHIAIEQGKKIAFLGENGSGKSTLFLLLNGIYRLKKGEYFFNGEKISYTKKQLRLLIENIGVVFQDPDVQLFASTVYQEISFGPKNLGCSDEEAVQRVECSMVKADLVHLKDKATHFLSYGEKKRVAIADILAMKSEIIILDEPLAWLDNKHEKKIIKILNDLSDEKKTIIISTHNPDLAYTWADYVYIMKEGRMIGNGKPLDVFFNEKLMDEAHLETPFVVKLSRLLNLNETPKNNEELLIMIQNR